MDLNSDVVRGYVSSLSEHLRSEYLIDEKYYQNYNIKRGLRNADGTGVMAGVTRIGSVHGYVIEDGERVPMPGQLYYRGYDLMDIVKSHEEKGTFGYEEVSYLLLMGKLPSAEQYDQFDTILSSARQLPPYFTEDMIFKSPSRNIMNKLARSVLALYSHDPTPDDTSIENLLRQSIELIGRFPIIVANAYAVKCHHFDGKSLYLHAPKESLSVSENFLRMLRHDKSYTREEACLLDLILMIHAEHGGGNNSAFACRVLSSTGTDTYSAIAAAVGSLKGPLHGGANAKVMEMFADIKNNVRDLKDDNELTSFLSRILDGSAGDGTGKIYGLGHAVYTISDPRAELIKKYTRSIVKNTDVLDDLDLLERIERIGSQLIMANRNTDIPVCANVDMYSGLVYGILGIPEDLFTPLFAIARISGWCAHRIEEIVSCRRIIRPAYRAAVMRKNYIPIDG